MLELPSTLPTTKLGEAIQAYSGHLVGASRTGSGKTTQMLCLIALLSRFNPKNEFFCASGKMSLWMGLEQQTASDKLPRVINVSLTRPETIEPLLARLRWAVAIQEQREAKRIALNLAGKTHNPRPLYFVLDEWLILLKVAKKHSKQAYHELIDLIECLILKGRQDKCFVWLWAQGHTCQSLHIDGDLRRNLGILALGGDGNYQSISAAINDPHLIESATERAALDAKYNELLELQPNGRIYYTSIGGHKLEISDNLPDMEMLRIFAPDPDFTELPAPPPPVPSATLQPEREQLEKAYEEKAYDKSPGMEVPPIPPPEPLQQDRFLELKEKELDLKERDWELKAQKYSDSLGNAQVRWNFTTALFGTAVFTIYLFPPLSGGLQTIWKTAMKVPIIAAAIGEKVEAGSNYWAPNLKKTPKVGDRISGYVVTSVYGWRDGKAIAPGASDFHRGIDIGTPVGTSLYAIANPGDSVVVKCWNDSKGGGTVATYESFGITFQYLHLKACAPGKQPAGSIIARTGSAGSGPHLHFEQLEKGKKIPPFTGYLWWALTGKKPEPFIGTKK